MDEKKVDVPKIAGPSFAEIGNSGLNHNGGWVYEELMPKLRWPKAGEVYQEMSSNDPVVTAILLCSKQLIKRITWTVQPASQEAADIEAAEFLQSCMEDLNTTWSSMLDDILSFLEYGWAYSEIVYKKRNGKQKGKASSKFDDGRIGWHKLAGRAQRSLHSWEIEDGSGAILGMNQYTDNGIKFIPIEKALLFRTTTARNNPEGKSMLRGAYRPWYFKKHIEEVEGIGIERDLAGLPVITVAEGVDIWNKDNPGAVEAKSNATKLVTSIRRDRNEGVVLPYGWSLELLSSASSRQFDTSAIINRYDQRIAITLLADIVMLGADKVGSFALAKTKESMLAACLDSLMSGVVEIFNDIAVPRLFELNTFKVEKLPKMVVSTVVSPDLTELGTYIQKLAGSKMPLFPDIDLENYLRSVAGLPEVTKDEELRQQQLEASKQVKTSTEDPNKKEEDDDANIKKSGKEEKDE